MSKENKKEEEEEKIGRISVSMKKSLIEDAKEAAKKQNRTLSNYIAQLIFENTEAKA